MQGEVTSDREAIVRVRLYGADSTQVEVDSVLDTGFNGYLTLPPGIMAEMGYPAIETAWAILADGSRIPTRVHEGSIFWNGSRRSIPVQATDGASLLGMSLLYGSLVTLEVLDGGSVEIEPLEQP